MRNLLFWTKKLLKILYLNFSLKFTNKPEYIHREDAVEFLVKPNRRILLHGSTQMETKSLLSIGKTTMKLTPKQTYLLTDILLVLDPSHKSKFHVDQLCTSKTLRHSAKAIPLNSPVRSNPLQVSFIVNAHIFSSELFAIICYCLK